MVLLEYRVEELQEHLVEIGGCVDIFYQLWEKHENEFGQNFKFNRNASH